MSNATTTNEGNVMMVTKTAPLEIRFKLNKNGNRIAQYWSWGAERWISMGVERAELLLSTGQAEKSDSKW